ncbi:hypothetical protein, partial [Streptomyces sp. NPDC056647]
LEIIEFKNRKKKHTRNDISFPFDSEPPPLTIPKGNRQGKIRPLSAPPEIVQQGVTPNKKTTTYKTGLASEKKSIRKLGATLKKRVSNRLCLLSFYALRTGAVFEAKDIA